MIHGVALGNKLHNADLSPRNGRLQVLDVGCGTGIWAYEMAQATPEADVFGIDLVMSQPTRDDNIPNCTFNTPVDFADANWGFPESHFDLIRLSQLLGSVADWSALYSQVYRHVMCPCSQIRDCAN